MGVVSFEFRDKSQLRVDAKKNISEIDPINTSYKFEIEFTNQLK